MATERTFAIIKPDAVAKNAIGGIITAIEAAGLRVIGLRLLRMSQVQAEGFYGYTGNARSFAAWSPS